MFSRARIRSQQTLSQLSQAALAKHRHAFSSAAAAAATESNKPTAAKVIFSGIQPTGVPHLGNYLGALKSWVALQNDAVADTKLLYSVVDLHAITVPQQADALRKGRRGMLAAMLAVGLDTKRSMIFYQSSVPAHAELMWILSCTASMGYLSRMTQWKSKLSLSEDTSALDEKAKASLKLGLFSYPVLQAADIMVHGATHVPVGEDQKQHIEFARECASNFNTTFSKAVLVPPEIILSPARRVMSLSKPTAKMSKSDSSPMSQVSIIDDAQKIRKKFSRALTDSQTDVVSYDRTQRPGVSNLLEILSILEGRTPTETATQFEGMQHPLKLLKERTADAVIHELAGVADRYWELMAKRDGEALDEIEALGAEKARINADVTIRRVKDAVGF